MAKISIIVPIYNTEKYLKKCLNSIINQTFKDIEIICINSCSKDNSLNILKSFAQSDNRIKIINLTQSHNVGYARNKGLKIVSGGYVSFVDSDDFIDLNYYEELYKKVAETNADIVKCKMCIINTDGKKEYSNLNDLIKNKSKMQFLNEFTTAIYKTSLISENKIKFPEDLIISEDVTFLNRAVIKAQSVECIDNVNYYYCRRKRSLNSEKMNLNQIKSFLSAIEYILDDCDNALGKELSEELYAEFYFKQLNIIREYLLKKNNTNTAHQLCIQKYIELFHKCKTPEKLEQLFHSLHGTILYYLKIKNTSGLTNIFVNYEIKKIYKSVEQVILAELRSSIKKN